MKYVVIAAALLATAVFPVNTAQAKILVAFQQSNSVNRPVGREGSEEILAAKSNFDAGSMVYVYVRNDSDAPVLAGKLLRDNAGFEEWNSEARDWQWVWTTARPATIAPGEVAEIVLCLRSEAPADAEFELDSDGKREKFTLGAPPPARFGTIAFTPDRRTAYCFLVSGSKMAPALTEVKVYGADGACRWRNDRFENGARIAEVTFAAPVPEGKRLVFFATTPDGGIGAAASLRAFSDLAVFGTYGFGELERYADNGLSAFNSFLPAGRAQLDLAEKLGLKVVSGRPDPQPETVGHPALYAHLLLDEPDVHDFSQPGRPIKRRIGTLAPEMLANYDRVLAADPQKPALLTMDLTFTPFNYLIYGPLADISNPDIYNNTCGWEVKYIDSHLSLIKQVSAPRPFAYTYQSCWEEWSTAQGAWINRKEILAKGFDSFRDTTRAPRGFGFNTNPAEMTIATHYAVGNGAVALFAYTDATETGGGLLIHGSDVLPENWATVGEISRRFRRVADLLLPAQPLDWAHASDSVWVKTLAGIPEAVLVVAVNEQYHYSKEGFSITPVRSDFSLAPASWFAPQKVYRVTGDGFHPIEAQVGPDGVLVWQDTVADAALYLVSTSETAAQTLIQAAEAREAAARDRLAVGTRSRDEFSARADALRREGTAVDGVAIAGYLEKSDLFPIQAGESWNAIAGWEADGVTTMGAEWNFSVTQPGPVTLLWAGSISNAPAEATVTAPDGSVCFELRGDFSQSEGCIWEFNAPAAGRYHLRTVGTPETPREHGNHIERRIYIGQK